MNRLMKHTLLLLLVFTTIVATTSQTIAQDSEGRIEFNGRHYNSLEEIMSASTSGTNSIVGCGPRMTQEVLNA